ncbi:hypothetical protein BU25DRAFT_412387 [Macroventuria anomochaeta]|uniref:Uncharacterized protein n=1 Tax=Macroventuria anomochaeta TaxID=301207 RepID=A0ACB6RVD7_9PLEO|nr:uncharacterized protein BU25DRAFT_412387 [Macroventuria anomochaeta]KAF2625729.1 hypothetical protein BU25DRAFT_412387 [Macroventuria anomochaeta]
MRYALIFAGVAAAYDAYGYDAYSDNKASSSTPAVKYSSSVPAYGGYGDDYKTSSAPAPSKSSSSSKVGYTTIHPGYGKQPVTVTSQYQPYPTCGAAGSDGKSCDKWNEDKYVSTVIDDYDSKKVTVTYVEKPITVYHTKTTVTHYPTASSEGSKDGKAYPTGSYGYDDKKNGTKVWYELYEKVHEIKYKDLGAHGLPGYSGSGLCKSCDDEQPYKVKEYKNGKWSEYDTTAVYKVPTPETKTYEKPGVYTEPAKDVTVTYTTTKPSEATTTAKAGVPVTYGGVTTDFKETGVKTCAYGAYETGKDKNGKDVTSTVVKTITVTVSTTGKYEVAKPTTTIYDHDTEVKYPTVSVYKPGVYHKDAQTVTITKSGDSASCEYKQTKTYPAEPKKTPTYGDEYPPYGGKSSSKPSVEIKTSTEYKPDYPASTPSVSKSSSKPDKYPATSSAPYYPEYPVISSTPVYNTKNSSSTPCASSSSKPSVDTKTKSVEYPTSTPVHGDEYPPYKPSSSKPSVETKTREYPSYETSSVPSYDDKKSSSIEYPSYPTSSSVPSYDDKKSSTEYPQYPATTTVPHYETGKSTPCPSSTKPVDDHKSSSVAYPEYPVASSSPPVYEAYPTPTPAKYEDDNKFSYAPTPSKTTAAYPNLSSDYPEENKDNSYESGKGYGYAKRAGVVQRRQAAVGKRSAREIVV